MEIMDINTIYKADKLYHVSLAFPHNEGGAFSIPEGFNGVAVLFENEAGISLSDDMSSFLAKVIEAGMKLDPSQVLKANLCHTDVSLPKLAEQARARVVIIFGLGWLANLKNPNIQKNEIVRLFGMQVLVTDPLDVIQNNDAAKKAFWAMLKKIV